VGRGPAVAASIARLLREETAPRRAQRIVGQLLRYAVLIVVLVVMAFPLVWLIATSLKTQDEVFGRFIPHTVTFANFSRVWTGFDFPRHFVVSSLVTLATIALVLVLATPAAYAFARYEFPGREAFFFVFLAAMMVPPLTLLIPMFLFLQQLSLMGEPEGLVIAYLGPAVGFSTFILRAFFRSLPAELADSARVDGCSEFRIFYRIFLPLARPGLATVVILQFVFTWNEFMFATTYILEPNKQTLQPSLFTAIGRYSVDWPALSAGLVLSIVPIILVYLAMQRHFERGIVAGAVKG
jgi:ABC-type glycerol-3-phosphate transport system permease component